MGQPGDCQGERLPSLRAGDELRRGPPGASWLWLQTGLLCQGRNRWAIRPCKGRWLAPRPFPWTPRLCVLLCSLNVFNLLLYESVLRRNHQ